jgi:Domain of unknown function (DUF6473)
MLALPQQPCQQPQTTKDPRIEIKGRRKQEPDCRLTHTRPGILGTRNPGQNWMETLGQYQAATSKPEKHMSLEYQREDAEAFDYRLFRFGHLHLRGPEPPLEAGQYWACIGAAQAFGRYVDAPYPSILSERLGLPCLNLGIGGAGPNVFRAPYILEAINQARFVVVQILSGRSSSNSFLDGRGAMMWVRKPGLRFESEAVRDTILADIHDRARVQPDPDDPLAVPVGTGLHTWLAYQLIFNNIGREYCEVLRSETKLRHTLDMIAILAQIRVPKVLFYYSEREPDAANTQYTNFSEFFGIFPHFVDQESIDYMSPHADAFVKCVSTRGKPHRLGRPLKISTPQGTLAPIEINKYYPSPEMHEDAAAVLLDTIVQKQIMAP